VGTQSPPGAFGLRPSHASSTQARRTIQELPNEPKLIANTNRPNEILFRQTNRNRTGLGPSAAYASASPGFPNSADPTAPWGYQTNPVPCPDTRPKLGVGGGPIRVIRSPSFFRLPSSAAVPPPRAPAPAPHCLVFGRCSRYTRCMPHLTCAPALVILDFRGRGAAVISSRAGIPSVLRMSGRKGPIADPPKLERKANSYRLGSQVNTGSLSSVLKRVERYRE